MPYRFRGYTVSDPMLESLQRYISHGVPLGDFLTAVIENDLREACGRADDDNLPNLPAFVAYLYNEAPGACWGSREKMRAWLDRFEKQRAQLAPDVHDFRDYPNHAHEDARLDLDPYGRPLTPGT